MGHFGRRSIMRPREVALRAAETVRPASERVIRRLAAWAQRGRTRWRHRALPRGTSRHPVVRNALALERAIAPGDAHWQLAMLRTAIAGNAYETATQCAAAVAARFEQLERPALRAAVLAVVGTR